MASEGRRAASAETAAARSRQRLEDLEAVTDAALSYLPLETLMEELLVRVVDVLEVDTAAILLLEDDGRTLVARAAKGLEEEVERRVRIPVSRGFAGTIAAERRPIHIEDIEYAEIVNPLLREKGLISLLGVPLLLEGDLIGVMHVGSLTKRQFGDTDVGLLQRAADRVALAVGRRLSERERGLAVALQDALFPVPLPQFPATGLAARYLPARSAALGGDWYDAFALSDGTVGVAIGDVVGRGFHAAALMGQLRAGLRAYALEGREPEDVLRQLNVLLRHLEPGGSATVAYLVYEPNSAAAEFVSAGHTPPLLVGPEESEYVEVPSAVPLGTVRDAEYEAVRIPLEPGHTALLYTDGLVENPNEPLTEGLERLRLAAEDAGPEPGELCDKVLDTLLAKGARPDDVALIALSTRPLSDPMHLRIRADLDSVPRTRRVLTRWLHERGATRDEIDRVVLAATEASANAVEHAYTPDDAEFELEAQTTGPDVVVRVRDKGQWRPPRGRNRGRGLVLIEGLMDRVDIERESEGTTVTMACRREEPN